MAELDYTAHRVEAALKAAKGDRKKAQRVLMGWALDDEQLLRGLATPHLQGITAHALKHAPKVATSGARGPQRRKITPDAMDRVVTQLGREIGVAKPDPVGLQSLVEQPGTTMAGPRHVASLRQIAVAYARKRFDP